MSLPWPLDLMAGLVAGDLLNFLYNLLLSLIYPFAKMMNVLLFWISDILNLLVLPLNLIINIFNTVSGVFVNQFTGVFPNVLLFLVGISFTVTIAFRIYYFLKDVEILGNKL